MENVLWNKHLKKINSREFLENISANNRIFCSPLCSKPFKCAFHLIMHEYRCVVSKEKKSNLFIILFFDVFFFNGNQTNYLYSILQKFSNIYLERDVGKTSEFFRILLLVLLLVCLFSV